ncbi:MAG: class I SAM-dependent methyltransferase [Alphaproteobacteria bacterium]|nr:MAG: class I SAM-dependent methyltransferase [Alphaproteobacteria bacterium]
MDMLSALWGENVTQPADGLMMREWIKTFGLDKTKTILDLSAGVGDLARHIATTYGSYVDGLESDEELALVGAELSCAGNLQRQADISAYDPESFAWPRHVDLVLMRPLLYRLHDKERFLDAVAQCMKAHAPLAMLEYTANDPASPALAAWTAEEGGAHPWSMAQMKAAMERRSLNVRIAEDVTAAYRHEIVAGLCQLTRKLETLYLTPAAKQIMMREVRPWMMRADALEKGLKVTRFYATRIRAVT